MVSTAWDLHPDSIPYFKANDPTSLSQKLLRPEIRVELLLRIVGRTSHEKAKHRVASWKAVDDRSSRLNIASLMNRGDILTAIAMPLKEHNIMQYMEISSFSSLSCESSDCHSFGVR